MTTTCPGMARAAGDRDRMLEWFPTRIAELEAELGDLAADDPRIAPLKEDLILNRLLYEKFESDLQPPAPSLTFSDRMTLDLGDTPEKALGCVGDALPGSKTRIQVAVQSRCTDIVHL